MVDGLTSSLQFMLNVEGCRVVFIRQCMVLVLSTAAWSEASGGCHPQKAQQLTAIR